MRGSRPIVQDARLLRARAVRAACVPSANSKRGGDTRLRLRVGADAPSPRLNRGTIGPTAYDHEGFKISASGAFARRVCCLCRLVRARSACGDARVIPEYNSPCS